MMFTVGRFWLSFARAKYSTLEGREAASYPLWFYAQDLDWFHSVTIPPG